MLPEVEQNVQIAWLTLIALLAAPAYVALVRWRSCVILTITTILCAGLWVTALKNVPSHWLGLMDGYLYSMFIKVYTQGWLPLDATSTYPAAYPFYAFYITGRIAAFFDCEDPGSVYKWFFLVTYTCTPTLIYVQLKHVIDKNAAALAASTVVPLFIVSNTFDVFQKPHEIWALALAFPAFVSLVSDRFHALNRNIRFLTGVSIGLSFGIYSPYAVGIAFSFLVLVIAQLRTSFRNSEAFLFRHAFDPPFLVGTIITAAPWFMVYLWGYFAFGGGPHVSFMTLLDLRQWFLDPSFDRIWFFTTISTAIALLLLENGLARKLAVAAITTVCLYEIFVIAAPHHLHTSIFKYYTAIFAIVPLAVAAWADTNESRRLVMATATIFLLVLMPHTFFTHLVNGPHYRFSDELSRARLNNRRLQEVVALADEYFKGRRFVYLGNNEAHYMNYYLKSRGAPHLYYNHTYVSAFENRQTLINRLKAAVKSNDYDEFEAYLKHHKIELLWFSGKREDSYPLSVVCNDPKVILPSGNNQYVETILLPTNWFEQLKHRDNVTVLRESDEDVVLAIAW